MGLAPYYNVPIPGTCQASHTMAANARHFYDERIQNHLDSTETSTEAAIVWI